MAKASEVVAKQETRHLERKARKELLLREAATLFVSNGYEKTTMNDIAAAMGMKGPAIYYYVDSKEELISLIFRAATERFKEQVIDRVYAVDDAEERLRVLVRSGIELCLRDREVALLLGYAESQSDQGAKPHTIAAREHSRFIRKVLKTILDDYAKAKKLEHPIDLSVAVFFLSAMNIWLPKWFRSTGRLNEQELVNEMTRFVLQGFAG